MHLPKKRLTHIPLKHHNRTTAIRLLLLLLPIFILRDDKTQRALLLVRVYEDGVGQDDRESLGPGLPVTGLQTGDAEELVGEDGDVMVREWWEDVDVAVALDEAALGGEDGGCFVGFGSRSRVLVLLARSLWKGAS